MMWMSEEYKREYAKWHKEVYKPLEFKFWWGNENLNWEQSKLNNNNMINEIMNKYYHLESAYGSKEEMKEHFLSGEVTMPIKDVVEIFEGLNGSTVSNIPFKYKNGDHVRLDFFNAGFVKNCTIIKVHFTDSKVLYDVDVTIGTDVNGAPNKTRLYNIDSCFVVD